MIDLRLATIGIASYDSAYCLLFIDFYDVELEQMVRSLHRLWSFKCIVHLDVRIIGGSVLRW